MKSGGSKSHHKFKEKEDDMIRCTCGLIVASDKIEMHNSGGEHLVKILSDSIQGMESRQKLLQDKKK